MKKNDCIVDIAVALSVVALSFAYLCNYISTNYQKSPSADIVSLFDKQGILSGKYPTIGVSSAFKISFSSFTISNTSLGAMAPYSYLCNPDPFEGGSFKYLKFTTVAENDQAVNFKVYFSCQSISNESLEEVPVFYHAVGLSKDRVTIITNKEIPDLDKFQYFLLKNGQADLSRGSLTFKSIEFGFSKNK